MAKEAHGAAQNESPPAGGAPSLRSRLLGLPGYLRANPLRGSIVVGGIVLAAVGVAAGLTLALGVGARPAYMQQLAQAFARLDAKDWREARRLAAELLGDSSVPYKDQGGAFYILGAVTLHDADEQLNAGKRQMLDLIASRYLEEASNRGVPQTRAPDGLVFLGRALHDAGRFARSIPALREAIAAAPQETLQLHALLADSYLRVTPPRLAEALEHHRLYAAAASLSDPEREAARLMEARILLAQRNYDAAMTAAGRVPSKSSVHAEAVVLQSRILLERLRQPAEQRPDDAEGRVTAMIEELRALAGRENLTPSLAAQAQLLIGLGLQQQGDSRAASAQFDRTRRTFFAHPEGLAALVFYADLTWMTNPLEAAGLYRRALSLAGAAETYVNDWLPPDQLQRRLESAVDGLSGAGQFTAALELAEALIPLFPRAVALGKQVEAYRQWARKLEEQAGALKALNAAVTLAEARIRWREAGAAGRQLAELRITTRYYLDDLARAADDFRRGQGYEQAVAVYRDLLRQDPPRGQPEALVGLGEALLALGQTEAALSTLNGCRDVFPTHPVAYRARLLVSQTLQEKGSLAEAKELLLDNLYRYSLAPQSSEWRDSLFALGNLMYGQALGLESKSRLSGVDRTDADSRREGLALLEQSHTSFEEAIRILGEAVQRYVTAPQTVEARYHIAEAHRHSAKWPRKRLPTVTIETSRASLTRQMQGHLQAVVSEYNALITKLSEEPDTSREPTELAVLRNCYFGRADALFDLERYDQAIEAYSAATNRYQHNPESLEAYVQIASCYRRMDRNSEARGTIEQARVVLQRIRPDADFVRTTRLARQDWALLLDWLRTL